MKVLIDTNVISELRRPDANPSVRVKLAAIDDEDRFISVISVGEIAYGIAALPPGKRRTDLHDWLEQLERFFHDRVLPIDTQIARIWGDITATARKAGRTLHAPDGLIAATALHHKMQIMTRNVADFEPAGVSVINPWGL